MVNSLNLKNQPLFPVILKKNGRGFFCMLWFCALIVPVFSLSALSLDETIGNIRKIEGAGGKQVEFRWDPFFQAGVFSLGDHTVSFLAGSQPHETGYLLLDNTELFTAALPFQDKDGLFFPDDFSVAIQNVFSRAIKEDAGRFRIAAIIIDPGHGGKDSGATSKLDFNINGKTYKAIEKNIVLEVSKRLKTVLEQAYPGKQILMTRDSDTFPSLDARTAIANSVPLRDNEAIIYISIHANKTIDSNSRARGYEVWYLNPNIRRNVIDAAKYTDSPGILPILNDMLQEEYTTESVIIARSILKSFGEVLGPAVPSRGLKAGEWMVVKNSRMPAVLVELGFLDNRDDVILMTTDDGLHKLTEALYKGITGFIGVFESSGGFTAVR
jgi:N-acetylmuramoyl-L-alanine amidase